MTSRTCCNFIIQPKHNLPAQNTAGYVVLHADSAASGLLKNKAIECR
ncbi:MAG: hypothetical protein HC853_01070 [Anaerolineae bacterium]|nr:hypothetical protein [Anaerolineae bacterium]